MANQERKARNRAEIKAKENNQSNSILGGLPPGEMAQLEQKLEASTLSSGATLYEPDSMMKWAYFVDSGVVSLVAVLSSGGDVEVGLIGHEGMVGHAAVLGGTKSTRRAIVQLGPARVRRIKAEDLRWAFRELPIFRERVSRFMLGLSEMTAQTAACNSFHEVEARLAKWLLMCQDRVQSDMIPLTQEFLANMLGVRRTTVTLVAGTLHRAGLIQYSRGKINVMKRAELERAACECYSVMREEFLSLVDHGPAQRRGNSL